MADNDVVQIKETLRKFVSRYDEDQKRDQAYKLQTLERIHGIENQQAVISTKIDGIGSTINRHEDSIDNLKLSDKRWGGISAVISAIAVAMAALLKGS